MPALIDNQVAIVNLDTEMRLVCKDNGDNQEDGHEPSVGMLIVTTKSEVVTCGQVATESRQGTEIPEQGSLTYETESSDIRDEEEIPQDNDDTDSDFSSMTTATPPISCGEDEELPAPSPRPAQDVMTVEIKFGERDVLDLAATLTAASWSLRPAVLPPMNLHMFWQNRAQYHRLGNYGTEENNMIGCRYCGFQYNLQK